MRSRIDEEGDLHRRTSHIRMDLNGVALTSSFIVEGDRHVVCEGPLPTQG